MNDIVCIRICVNPSTSLHVTPFSWLFHTTFSSPSGLFPLVMFLSNQCVLPPFAVTMAESAPKRARTLDDASRKCSLCPNVIIRGATVRNKEEEEEEEEELFAPGEFKTLVEEKGEVFNITSGKDFAAIYHELVHSRDPFYTDLDCIAAAYREGNLYSVRFSLEDDEFYHQFCSLRKGHRDKVFVKSMRGDVCLTRCLLPTFMVYDPENHDITILWTHERARGCGIAAKLVRYLNINSVGNIAEGSEGFWKKLGIQYDRVS